MRYSNSFPAIFSLLKNLDLKAPLWQVAPTGLTVNLPSDQKPFPKILPKKKHPVLQQKTADLYKKITGDVLKTWNSLTSYRKSAGQESNPGRFTENF